jgi:ATP-dependent DNA helicase PIF1
MNKQIILNEQQLSALTAVKEGHNIFITGSPGTGKSFILKYIISHLKSTNRNLAVTSSTGCSAVLIRGQTIHSYLYMGTGEQTCEKIVDKIKGSKKKLNQLMSLQIIIIDEISMIDNHTLEKISGILQRLREYYDKPFGGIQVIFVGDFCQLAPVNGNYCFKSHVWNDLKLKNIYLKELIRQKDDVEFQNILETIRFGKCTKKVYKRLESLKDTQLCEPPTKLYSLNEFVDAINLKEYKKVYKINNCNKSLLKNANIIICTHTLTQNANAYNSDKDIFRYVAYTNDKFVKIQEYTVDLMKGLQVMVTRNLDFETGLINGTTGIIVDLDPTTVCIKDRYNKIHKITYHTDINMNDSKLQVTFVPIKMAYAMSIHKSQGATLDSIEVDGSTFVFAPGQLYTALSRAKNLNSIRLLNLDRDSFICNQSVKEFYEHLLQDNQ